MADNDTLVGLVSQYSPSGQESAAVNWLVQRMLGLGFPTAFVDGAGNAVGVTGSGPRQIILLGHIDTVPGQIPVKEENGILFGRGAVDAKGPLACFVDAASQVQVIDGWQIIVIGAVEEERNSDGARFIAPLYHPEYALIGEPNHWDRVALGYKGSAWADIVFKRPLTHSASGEVTASEAAIKGWAMIQHWAELFNTNRQRVFDKVLLTLNRIDSGQDEFSQWARLEIGARLPVNLPPHAWYSVLAGAVKLAEPIQMEMTPKGHSLPAWTCEKNTKVVRAILSGIRAESGTPSFVFKTGTADLNVVAPVWKCPAAVYGPGDSALDHTPNEHISLEEYHRSVRVLRHALTQLMQIS